MRALTPDILLRAYAMGLFPMAQTRDDPKLYWIDPDERGILPLDRFHIPRSLKKTLKQGRYQIRVDTAFRTVLEGCAEAKQGREETWINNQIADLFCHLHAMGLAHSVESWDGDTLVGGLYGLALGGAFFGESMFSRRTDASKVALVDLVARLKLGGTVLLDTQFITDHLSRFGVVEIPRYHYKELLAAALQQPATFLTNPVDWSYALSVGPEIATAPLI
ncbi:leucyl/phenylalanyl-tRNA--protein transferase [Magnetospirillum sulfuroxidans]|uniref:Leucyl/phenylalanyl-tRNA--protein transferase n=1 Tax=Magnetospirillum sulfuroxidans TaxID=611300 RepID=A0ABS5I7P9_9PROT|nr:leucyl/phenylalanyl-tRNA--protein transferase [Magnetospirillum sulfuroxidans]MBR9970276.1 leucyl/phenylalanyl-tRNA--protein transferase [Magnetospirillum sulfuroxidans]